ncbi:MAG: YfhO family protein, partial [Anaerolineae bacterium]|nr:YfhO family protein [Anaerolineae bacterium]
MTRRRANTAVQQRYVRDWAPLIFLAGGVLLFFWPVWVAGFTFPQGGGDLFGQLQHVWTYVAGWVRKGVFPLWSTRMMAGDPIVAEAQYGLFNPLNWPLFLAPSISRDILLLRVAVTLWLAGSGMYLYLRRSPVWRRSRSAALAAGVAYMLSNPFITHLGHPQFNDVMAWLPWVLWGLDGATRRKRAIPLAGLALAALLLAGHGQAALYAILVISAYSLWQVLEGGPRAPRRIGRLALVALLAAALAAPS